MEPIENKKDYIKQSIFCAILLEVFFGLMALYNAMGAKNDFEDQQFEVGVEKAQKAKKFCVYSLVLGIIKWIAVAVCVLWVIVF